MLARGAVCRGLVAGVAAASQTALEEGYALSDFGEVGEQGALLIVGEDLRADGNLDDEIVAARAGPVGASAALAPRGAEMLGVAEVDKRIQALHRLEHNIAALAAVAAVGPAIFDELLAAEAHRARSAGAGANEDLGLVEEMHGRELGEAGGEGNLSRTLKSHWSRLSAGRSRGG